MRATHKRLIRYNERLFVILFKYKHADFVQYGLMAYFEIAAGKKRDFWPQIHRFRPAVLK